MSETEKHSRVLPLVLTVVFLLVAAGLGYLGIRVLDRLDQIEAPCLLQQELADDERKAILRAAGVAK